MSTPTASHQHVSEVHPSPPGGPTPFPPSHGQVIVPPRQSRGPVSNAAYQASSLPPPGQPSPSGDFQPPTYANYTQGQGQQAYGHTTPGPQGPVLPPFSHISSTMGPPTQQGNVSSLRYQSGENAHTRNLARNLASGSKRQAPTSSNVTSADSSDLDDEENGELPASGLVAPWEVLRGLADVAIERAAKVCKHQTSEDSDFSPFLKIGKWR